MAQRERIVTEASHVPIGQTPTETPSDIVLLPEALS